MTTACACAMLKHCARALLITAALCTGCLAEGPTADALPLAPVQPSPLPKVVAPEMRSRHKFWDWENRTLFTTVAALNTIDFAATRYNLQNGARELDPVTRLFSHSTAGLAVNFAGATAASIGLSYWFHKTGHHRLERLTSMVNISASTAAVTYSAAHR